MKLIRFHISYIKFVLKLARAAYTPLKKLPKGEWTKFELKIGEL